MTTKEMKTKLLNPIINVCSVIQLVFVMMFISSFFILIWNTWDLAWKIGLTGLIGFIITGIIYLIFKKLVGNVVDLEFKKRLDVNDTDSNTKSKFLTRLEEELKNKTR